MFFRVMGRMTVRFFAGLGGAIAGIFKSIIRHPVGSIFTLLVIGGIVAAAIFTNGFGISTSKASDSSVISAEPSQQSSGKSEEFLNSFGKMNAGAMWNLLSDKLKQSEIASGITSGEAMQKRIDSKIGELAKDKSKPRYRFLWIRGQTNSDGTAQDIFRGDVEWPAAGAQIGKLFAYIINTDKDGKVGSVLTQGADDPGLTDPLLDVAFPGKEKGKEKDAGYGQSEAKRKAATEEFMGGVTNFDAKRVWNAFSVTYQNELKDKGVTVDTMQKAFDQVKKQTQDSKLKLGYSGFTLRQSTAYPNGNSVDNYWASLQIGDQVQLPDYTLLVDKEYKIIAVGTSDPFLSSGLGRKQQAQ